MEDALPAVPSEVGRVDFKGNFPFLGHMGKHSQQTIPKNLVLAFKGEGRRPFRRWGLLLCLPQHEKKEEKTRREPRHEAEQLHAEHKGQFSKEFNLYCW